MTYTLVVFVVIFFFFFQAEDGIRDLTVTGVQTCALPISSAGSFGRYELKAHAGARAGPWDYYLGARYEREAGWRDATQSRIATLFAKVGLLNGTWDATLSYSGADNRILQAGSLPDSVAAASPRVNFTSGDYFAPQAHLVIVNAQRLLGRMQLALNAFGRSLNGEQFNVNFVGEDSRQLTRTRIGGGAVQLSGKVHLIGRELRWLAGADADYLNTGGRIFAVKGGAGPDSLAESVRTNQADAGGFAGGTLEIVPGLTTTLAARYDWIDRKSTRLNSSHSQISYAVFCLKKKK